MENYLIKNILVPTDFSELSRNALRTSIAIAKRHKAAVTLIHVLENNYLLLYPDVGGDLITLSSKVADNAKESMRNLVDLINLEHGIEVSWNILSGNPADEICKWAMEKNVSLIIMGTHGVSGLREFFIGSNAYSVVKHAPCPVMTIPGSGYWPEFKRILFPIRMIPNALEKYDVVRPIIKKNGASLILAGLVEREHPMSLVEMRRLVNSIKKVTVEDNVTADGEVHYCEDIAGHVLHLAEKEQPDLIVITATLEKTYENFFVGPYTQQIVNHSKHPVLSIRPGVTRTNISDAPFHSGYSIDHHQP